MTQSTWYYEKNGKAEGPISESELLDLIAYEKIDKNTLVWQKPMKEWTKASSIESFKDKFSDTPPPLPGSTKTETPIPEAEKSPFSAAISPPSKRETTTQTLAPEKSESDTDKKYPGEPIVDGINQVQPWSRFYARSIDYAIYGIFLFFIMSYMLPFAFQPYINDRWYGGFYTILIFILISIASTFICAIIQSFFVSSMGNTIGKFIFGIYVQDQNGRLLTQEKAFNRELYVWLDGLGLGTPIVNLLAMAMSYDFLKNHGITSWDNRCNVTVRHMQTNLLLQSIGYVLVFFIYSFLFAFLFGFFMAFF